MKYGLSLLGMLAAIVLLLVSAAMNWRFGFSLGNTEMDSHIYGAASAAADGLKALLPFFILWALRQRNYSQVISGMMLWLICGAYSLTSSLGFSALNRADTTGARYAQVETYKSLKTEIDRTKEKLKWIPKHRSEGEIRADLSAVQNQPTYIVDRGRRVWGTVQELTKDCTVLHFRARKSCSKILNHRKELAIAKQSKQLEERLTVLNDRMRNMSNVSKAMAMRSDVDPQVTLLSKLTGIDPENIRTTLIMLVALMVELGSGVGLFVAFGHFKPNDGSANPGLEPEVLKVSAAPVRRLLLPKSDVERYYSTCTEKNEGSSITATALYEDYRQWCEGREIEALALPVFGRQFSELGVQKAKIGGRIRYLGLSIIEREDVKKDPEDAKVVSL